jgi:putative nucleotidyltransferase with HDIG domain
MTRSPSHGWRAAVRSHLAALSRRIYLAFLFLVSVALAIVVVLFPMLEQSLSPAPTAGQLADRNYLAPRAITYASEILTEQKRQIAERTVSPIYTLPDTRLARQQLEALRATLAYISSVRADAFADSQQKLEDLAALEDITLNPSSGPIILGLTDARWQEIQQESIVVLEKVMSSSIRPEGLVDARSHILAKVSLTMPEEQASMVSELVSSFVVPNSQYSDALTQEAQQKVRLAISPVTRSYAPGQIIAFKGQVLEEEEVEALHQLGLVGPGENLLEMVSATTLTLLLLVLLLFYLGRRQALWNGDVRKVGLMAVLFLGFLCSARLVIPAHTVIPYAFPLATFCLTIAVLFGVELAMVFALPLAILTTIGLPNALELTIYYTLSGMFGILAAGRARRLASFFWAGAAIAVAGSVIILIYRSPLPTTDRIGLLTLIGASFFNGLASASLTILLQNALAGFLGTVTPLQLMDLTRPDHPLLHILLQDAPGTYQHSLQVANLAEQAAEQIGADPLLTRVGALYHDIGKTRNPFFFIENQPPGSLNPHDDLVPEVSAGLVIRHVSDGMELGRKYHLPERILDFIAEHHGTAITRYQYCRAIEAVNGDERSVDADKFRYPGPRPRSLEVAVLMLADGSEARVRAERPENEEKLRILVEGLISDRVSTGQLDETELSLKDLTSILESFVATLRGMYHPRLTYPQLAQLPDTAIQPDANETREVILG